MNLAQRLRLVLQELDSQKIDQIDIANVAGVTKGTVSQWLSGQIKSMKLEYAAKIQEVYGYNAIWLVMGKGPKTVKAMAVAEGREDQNLWPFRTPKAKFDQLPIAAREKIDEYIQLITNAYEPTFPKGQQHRKSG